jgi:hypothetical protein
MGPALSTIAHRDAIKVIQPPHAYSIKKINKPRRNY